MKLRSYRKVAGLTQRVLAERVGCDQSAISRLERGERSPTLAMLRALSGALGVPPERLIQGDDDKEG